MNCPTCPVSADCHSPAKPEAACHDRSGFWSLESRQQWEALHGRSYGAPCPPARIDHARERLEAAANELRAAGWFVQQPGAKR